MTSLSVLFGISHAISGIATSMIRAVTFWFQILVDYVMVQWIGIRFLLGRNFRQEESFPEKRGPQQKDFSTVNT
jgi:hypothetical protein